MAKRKRGFFQKILLLICSCLILVVIGISALLSNPQWLVPLLESQLQQNGFTTKIERLDSLWDWPSYHISSEFSVQKNGLSSKSNQLFVKLGIQQLFNRKAFVEQLKLRSQHSVINFDQLRQSSNKLSFGIDERLLPKDWVFACQNCQIQGADQRLYGNVQVQGQGDRQVKVKVIDQSLGVLNLIYDQEEHQLIANSQQLSMESMSGYQIVLKNLHARIDLDNVWQSHANTHINYQGVESQVNVFGEGENQLRLEAMTADKSFSVKARRESNRLMLDVDEFNLSLFDTLRPALRTLLSKQLSLKQDDILKDIKLSGIASGQIILWEKSPKKYQLERVQLNLERVNSSHASFGIANVSAAIHWFDDHLDFNMKFLDSQLNLPNIFTQSPSPFSGQFIGQFSKRNSLLSIEKLSLHSADFDELNTSGSLSFKHGIVSDLKGDMRNLSLVKLKQYLPEQFPKKTGKWLKKAFLSGKKNQTSYLLKGDLKKFLKDKKFIFQLRVDAHDGVFHYLEKNPNVVIKKARLIIDQRKLSVIADAADLFVMANKKRVSVPITATATVDNIRQASLNLRAKVNRQPIARLLALSKRSVARRAIRKVERIVTVGGDFSLDLELHHALDSKKPDAYELSLLLTSEKANALLKQYPNLQVNNAKVRVRVNEKGLEQLDIAGKVLKQSVNIAMQPILEKQKKSGYDVHIQAKNASLLSILPRLNLLKKHESSTLKKHGLIHGRSDYDVGMKINAKGSLETVTINSELKNTAINVFDLFVKGEATKQLMTIKYQPQRRHLSIHAKKRLYLEAGLDKNGQLTGLLLDNLNTQAKYKKGQVRAFYRGKKLNLNQLMVFFSDWVENKKKKSFPKLTYQLDIAIEKALLSGNAVPIYAQGNLDKMTISSPIFSGNIHYKNNYLQANLSRLSIDRLIKLFAKQSTNSVGREVKNIELAKQLPAMDVVVENVIYKANNVGAADIHTSLKNNRYSIDQLFIRGRDYYFDASGYEANEPQGITTKIHADFKGEDLRRLVQLFKLNDFVSGQFLDVSLNLSWPGEVHTLNLEESYGEIDIGAKSVKLVNLSSGIGGIFGLMDIGGILKRLTLDFQNLTSSKLFFDEIKGHWNIGGGRAMTTSAGATGSVVALSIDGAIDLHRRVFDDTVLTVTPKASNVIPVIGAVAGGVVGGAIGWVVQQVMGDAIDAVANFSYVISGSWDNPIMLKKGQTQPQ